MSVQASAQSTDPIGPGRRDRRAAMRDIRALRTRRIRRRTLAFFVLTSAFCLRALAGPRVLLISVDGLRTDVVTPERMPRLSALRDAGSAADHVVNDLPSVTMTNHATMLTGKTAATHAVVIDTQLPGEIGVPTLFGMLRDAGLRSAAYLGKSKLAYMTPRSALEPVIDGDTTNLVTLAIEQLAADGPDFVFVHVRDPDSVGHAHGWMSSMYLEAVTFADEQIDRLVAAADADASRPTYVIVTADHGGDGPNHFVNIPINRAIPFIAAGPGIPPGKAITEAVSTPDVTPTVLWLLGVTPPDGLAGRVLSELREPQGGADGSVVPAIGPPCAVFAAPLAGLAGFLALRRARHSRRLLD